MLNNYYAGYTILLTIVHIFHILIKLLHSRAFTDFINPTYRTNVFFNVVMEKLRPYWEQGHLKLTDKTIKVSIDFKKRFESMHKQ